MEISQIYAQTRFQLIDLAGRLSIDQATVAVPSTPGWCVRDVYAHLTGVCADVLDGRMEGGGSPGWTARQIAERATDDLAAITAEWSARGAELDALLRAQGDAAPLFPAFDIWTHQRDLMGALECPRPADERAAVLAGRALHTMAERAQGPGRPAVRVVTANNDVVVGAGEPIAMLSTADDEILRMIFGRRSRAQMTSARWQGEPGAALESLHLFDLRDDDLAD